MWKPRISLVASVKLDDEKISLLSIFNIIVSEISGAEPELLKNTK